MEALMKGEPMIGPVYARLPHGKVDYVARYEGQEFANALCKELHGHGRSRSCPKCKRMLDETPWWKPMDARVDAGSW